jgi:sirohydrochlorin ferrochelatase
MYPAKNAIHGMISRCFTNMTDADSRDRHFSAGDGIKAYVVKRLLAADMLTLEAGLEMMQRIGDLRNGRFTASRAIFTFMLNIFFILLAYMTDFICNRLSRISRQP